MRESKTIMVHISRSRCLLIVYAIAMVVLFFQAVYLQVLNKQSLQDEGDARALRIENISIYRGSITDRNGELLAGTTPISSIWAVPRIVVDSKSDLDQLATYLEMAPDGLDKLLDSRIGRQFAYLKRHVVPDMADQIMALNVPGVSLLTEYRRYYPTAEVSAHVVGFTDIDDRGQEGLELAYEDWLKGIPGKKRVLQDRLGRVVKDIKSISTPVASNMLELSIDQRVQYLAYRELKSAVARHKASAGSLVILDVQTGEIIAMVGQPSYNPNNRSDLNSSRYRNRALTDVFEPGSTMKPFTIAAALMSGRYTADTTVDTRPGFLKVNNHEISDHRDYGVIDLTTVIQKSSNIGASKVALSLDPKRLWEIFSAVGFGVSSNSGFPGESAGHLDTYHSWSDIEQATVSFGYGLSVTILQLAQAYSVLAADGMMRPISFLKVSAPVQARRVMPEIVARQIKGMLEAAVQDAGTGKKARIRGYRVAGKTGTVHKSTVGGYDKGSYLSIFVGMAPVHETRLVMAIMLDDPRDGKYYGSAVAAPLFAKVMTGALRLLDISPDDFLGQKG